KQAVDLLASAGWVIKGGKMVNAESGAPFRFEILDFRQGAEATLMPYVTMLRKIGIDASLRFVDQSQYVNRVNEFDFDMITAALSQSDSPGNEQRDFWSSRAADAPGSRNYSGIKDPIVDALVDRVIFASDRDDLIAATHALDRVLLWNFYVVPQFTRPDVWLAYWNKFGIPDKQPTYLGPDIDSWWIDPEKEKALAAKYKSGN
ncbi:MAG: ABC transporter substrate-binding protein, partial [Mesorhizobium sp.]|nr:ABC transporter substrate-binding protein [Mesorhizobium sp.]